MKTYDEVLDLFDVKVGIFTQDAHLERTEKYKALFGEILTNPRTESFLRALCAEIIQEECENVVTDDMNEFPFWFQEIVRTVYINGITIGMEMEKQ